MVFERKASDVMQGRLHRAAAAAAVSIGELCQSDADLFSKLNVVPSGVM